MSTESTSASTAGDAPAMGSSRVRRWLGLFVWLGVIVGYFLFARSRDLGPIEAAEELRQTLSGAWWAPIAFVVFYMIRPVVLFPATVLTILGGLIFGPVWGVAWSIVGSGLSTAVTYLISPNQPGSSVRFTYVANGELAGLNEELRSLQEPFVDGLATFPTGPSVDELDPEPTTAASP